MSAPTKRPRNVSVFQAAAILYGDWGTSKAYVIGLAFALAGYSSFWLIAAVCVLMILVGSNYITICKFSPYGGGVYTSARKHSEVLALVAAFFLLADYIITAAISSLACFEYFGVNNPVYWAIGSIVLVGVLNFFGPRHSGNLAFVVALMTVIVVIGLAVISLPYVKDAVQNIQPLPSGLWHNWNNFVGVIVALSGIEAIANATGVMRLDVGSTEDDPSVHVISKQAILLVMVEVCFFTAFFGFVVNAIPGLKAVGGQVVTPDNQEIRDYMLRYMGEYFVSKSGGGEVLTYFFGTLVSVVLGVLLLSAVNTAIVALVSLLFVMSRDGEMPAAFQWLTPFGVPRIPLIITVIAIIVVLIVVHDVAALANLYAVGFVGAIATNIGSNAWDKSLPLSKKERFSMWVTFCILVVIELTLFISKPEARGFAVSFIAIGLISRMLIVERRQRLWASKKVKLKHASLFTDDTRVPLHEGAILVSVRTIGKTLNFALQESKQHHQPLYILFIREQKIITNEDRNRTWLDDEDACHIFDYAKDSASEINMKFFYEVSDSPAETIVRTADRLKVSRLILGRPRHSVMLQFLRGNIVQEISEVLPPEIDLIVIS